MLADIYLTLAPSNPSLYNEVIDLCDEITSLGYDLSQCPYADNFNCPVRNGAESIFEVQYSGSTESDFRATPLRIMAVDLHGAAWLRSRSRFVGMEPANTGIH